jgi:hypothetical protein
MIIGFGYSDGITAIHAFGNSTVIINGNINVTGPQGEIARVVDLGIWGGQAGGDMPPGTSNTVIINGTATATGYLICFFEGATIGQGRNADQYDEIVEKDGSSYRRYTSNVGSVYVRIVSPPQQPPPQDDPIVQFVERLYRNVLNRNSDPTGLNNWTTQLRNHTRTGAEVAYGFFFSPEMRNRNLSNEDFVEVLYTTLMDRPSDPGGKNTWVTNLRNGVSRERVFAGFANSAEFSRICNEYGIIRGTYTPPGNQQTPPRQPVNETLIRAFVTRLYEVALGRQPDQGGLNTWTTALINGREGSAVAYGFIFSPEMRNRNLSNADFVEVLYNTLMGRGSDPAGKNTWVTNLNNGMSRERVFEGFVNSNEFNRICNDYGIVRGNYRAPR